jgi:hypothetical protein
LLIDHLQRVTRDDRDRERSDACQVSHQSDKVPYCLRDPLYNVRALLLDDREATEKESRYVSSNMRMNSIID